MNVRRFRPLTGEREVAELVGRDGREIRGLIWPVTVQLSLG